MREAQGLLQQRRTENGPPLEIALFRNADDPVQTLLEMQNIGKLSGAIAMPQRAGGHDYVDYARNGSVRDAFSFLLERM